MSHLATWPNVRRAIGGNSGQNCDGGHIRALAGAAGAAKAAGDAAAAGELLGRAGELEDERPSYYGAAWTALARVMLDTDWLGNCG